MWPFRRKPKQPVPLVEPDPGRGELLPSQLRDMQAYGWDGPEKHAAAELLDSPPAADDASAQTTDPSGGQSAPENDARPPARGESGSART